MCLRLDMLPYGACGYMHMSVGAAAARLMHRRLPHCTCREPLQTSGTGPQAYLSEVRVMVLCSGRTQPLIPLKHSMTCDPYNRVHLRNQQVCTSYWPLTPTCYISVATASTGTALYSPTSYDYYSCVRLRTAVMASAEVMRIAGLVS
jgi:hypothetical protein